MSNGTGEASAPDPAPATSPGRLLREARERQGLHIAALAASIKVAPKKLEMLEADRFDALPDATFTRALAQTVCRALKIDSGAIMRLLPPPSGHRLEQVGEGLNAPFRDRPGMLVQRDWGSFASSPAFWITALVMVAAAALYLVPGGLVGLPSATAPASSVVALSSLEPAISRQDRPGPTTLGRSGDEPAAAPSFIAAPTMPATAGSSAAAAGSDAEIATTPASASPPNAETAALAVLQVRTSATSWVEVSDARGKPLISRLVAAGETVGIDGAPPLRIRIGNAAATRITYRGQPTELAAFTRDNVARLELR